jgi:hypothetical protein
MLHRETWDCWRWPRGSFSTEGTICRSCIDRHQYVHVMKSTSVNHKYQKRPLPCSG